MEKLRLPAIQQEPTGQACQRHVVPRHASGSITTVLDNTSICIYHNGNSRILEFYKQKFQHLNFAGNLAESNNFPPTGYLWEVCFTDATTDNLLAAHKQNIQIVRHISNYHDDCKNLLPESTLFSFDDWLKNVVINKLCFADVVVCDESICDQKLQPVVNKETVIITTGRTANTHLVELLKEVNQTAYEHSKTVDDRFFQSSDAILLWRQDQWACLTSIWISKQSGQWKHQVKNKPKPEYNFKVDAVSEEWLEKDWSNLCLAILDHAMFYKYVLDRPINLLNTEQIIDYRSAHEKIDYNKKEILSEYENSKSKYLSSGVAELLNMLYNKIQTHIAPWQIPKEIK